MAVQHRKIQVDQLVVGMYVSQLDRPWIETPFPLQGFSVRELGDIDRLKRYCQYVYVDVVRSNFSGMTAKNAPSAQSTVPSVTAAVYSPRYRPLATELQEITPLFADYIRRMQVLEPQLRRGDPLVLQSIRQITTTMVDSILRNPNALVWLAHGWKQEKNAFVHALRSAVWALVFGRHLGLSHSALHILAQAMLLMDTGKGALPAALQVRTPQNVAEQALFQKHVDYGVAMLSHCQTLDPMIIQVVAQHHERYDGSGYPQRLSGKAILPMAKIAGIVDCYEQMYFPEEQEDACSSSQVINRLCALRNHAFQSSLVDEFVQAIGLYPSGALVQLTSRQVGVVLEPNPGQRFRPKVAILRTATGERCEAAFLLDLSKVLHDEQGQPLKIHAGLRTGAIALPPRVDLPGLLHGAEKNNSYWQEMAS